MSGLCLSLADISVEVTALSIYLAIYMASIKKFTQAFIVNFVYMANDIALCKSFTRTLSMAIEQVRL